MACSGHLPNTPGTQSCFSFNFPEIEVPIIDRDEPFRDVVKKIAGYIAKAVDSSYSYEQIRTTVAGQLLRPLVASLSEDCHHTAVVAATLASKWLFTSSVIDDTGINESRGLACELVAWEFLSCLAERELMDHLLTELPSSARREVPIDDIESRDCSGRENCQYTNDGIVNDQTPLLQRHGSTLGHTSGLPSHVQDSSSDTYQGDFDALEREEREAREAAEAANDPTKPLAGLNALEIAAVAGAKKFLSQRLVQRVVQDIWDGNIIFWESVSVDAVKKARVYNKRIADPYARLRVPKYAKAVQICFFASLLALYYMVLISRHPHFNTATELLLHIWIAAFAYDEFGEFQDAGAMFYQTDFWSLWDLGIILTGVAFLVLRMIGQLNHSDYLVNVSFDTLALQALFLVPRLFSLASLNPYFGSLIPVLKEMTKTIAKFLPVVVILYLAFLSTFSMLARDRLPPHEMSWLLIKVFFGASYLGFDASAEISPIFGATLMMIFVLLTNIILVTSLISLLSNSLTEVMAHAREEYLFGYSIYVLESSSTSTRLTYFVPPLNLIALLFRPLRLFLPASTLRQLRIFILKATHAPIVAVIFAYESSRLFQSQKAYFPPASHPSLHHSFGGSQGGPHAGHLGNRLSAPDVPLAPSTGPRSQQTFTAKSASAISTADVTDLLTSIQKLSSQVDELTTKVATKVEE